MINKQTSTMGFNPQTPQIIMGHVTARPHNNELTS